MKGLEFHEESGQIGFSFEKPCRHGGYYSIRKTIPTGIVKQGKKAILYYALQKVEEAEMQWRNAEFIENDIRKKHIYIQAMYKDGASLEGRIVEATNRFIRVELDRPLKGESSINFGFASAMAGHYVFTAGHKISSEGYDGARTALCWAYEAALHKPQKDLVKILNQMV